MMLVFSSSIASKSLVNITRLLFDNYQSYYFNTDIFCSAVPHLSPTYSELYSVNDAQPVRYPKQSVRVSEWLVS